ncbi:hypothetical protein PR048_008316 [Dryococelus australis]|uniref:Uncharacterized protein n=1 Tax=Dryococelus australis TaxID=614101 RepID=A0ABQ9HWR9_9NEOP|nr:hypothetical protein PR048_008316 [Dryococelus australis]
MQHTTLQSAECSELQVAFSTIRRCYRTLHLDAVKKELNEILQIMAHNFLRSTASDIYACGEFSLIEQVSINIRIVKDLEPEELFLGLYSTSSTAGE